MTVRTQQEIEANAAKTTFALQVAALAEDVPPGAAMDALCLLLAGHIALRVDKTKFSRTMRILIEAIVLYSILDDVDLANFKLHRHDRIKALLLEMAEMDPL